MKKSVKMAMRVVSVFLSGLLISEVLPLTAFAQESSPSAGGPAAAATESSSVISQQGTEEQPQIIAEDISRREEDEKHFLMSDGSYMAVQYASPVHFNNGEDGWQEYDNTLAETDALEDDQTEKSFKLFKDKDFVNQKADFSVRFSKKTNGKKLVRLEKDGYQLSWTYQGIAKKNAEMTNCAADDDPKTLDKLQSNVIYKNVFRNADLQYVVSGSTVKENFILHSANTAEEFVAEYKTKGLTAVQDSAQQISFCDPNGNAVFTLYAPCMFDANGAMSKDIALEIIQSKNNSVTMK